MNDIAQSYAVLDISPTASPLTTKQAYRKLAKIWHPDRYANNPVLKAQAEAKIKQINQAYAIIKAYQAETANNVASNSYSSTKTKVAKVQNTPEFYYQQGIDYVESQSYDAALNSFAQAIKLNPNYLEAYQYRGFILSKLGFNLRADAEFKKAHQIKLNRVTASYQKQYTPQQHPNPTVNATVNTTVQNTDSLQYCHTIIGFEQPIECLTVGYDGQIASVSDRPEIDLWQINTGRRIGILKGHIDEVTCMTVSYSGQTLISGSQDKTIRFWDLKKRKIIRTFGGDYDGHLSKITALALTPDNQTLISCDADNSLKIWDVHRARPIQNIYFSAAVTCLAISPNGRLFCSGGLEPELKIRSTKNGEVIGSINNNTGVFSLAFSPDGNLLATGGFNHNIKLWDLVTGREIYTLMGHSDRVSQIIFSRDGKTLISSSWDGTIKLWNLATGEAIFTQQAHSEKIHNIAMNFTNSASSAIASCSADNTIKVWQSNV